jgi:hypothetical protein
MIAPSDNPQPALARVASVCDVAAKIATGLPLQPTAGIERPSGGIPRVSMSTWKFSLEVEVVVVFSRRVVSEVIP